MKTLEQLKQEAKAEYKAEEDRRKKKTEEFQEKCREAIKTITGMAINLVSHNESVLPSELEPCGVYEGNFYAVPAWIPSDFKIVWTFFPPITITAHFFVSVENDGTIKAVTMRRGFVVDEYGRYKTEEVSLGKALVKAEEAKADWEKSQHEEDDEY